MASIKLDSNPVDLCGSNSFFCSQCYLRNQKIRRLVCVFDRFKPSLCKLACERRRISGCRDSLRRKIVLLLGYADVIFRRRESRQPEIRLRSQASANRFSVLSTGSPVLTGNWGRIQTCNPYMQSPSVGYLILLVGHQRQYNYV